MPVIQVPTLDDIALKMHAVPSNALAATADDPSPPSLMDLLNKRKAAPAATSVAVSPDQPTDADIANLNDILLLDSYVNVAGAAMQYTVHPAPYDITNPGQAAQFIRDDANARFRVLTQGLAGVLNKDNESQESFSKTTRSADLHMDFLNGFFSSFGFDDGTLKELDGILTNVANSLRDLKASWSDSSSTMDHLVCMYYFEKVTGLDYKLPKLRLFYMHIDQESWTLSIGKSSVSSFSFNMNYDDWVFSMAPAQMDKFRDTVQGYVTKMTGQNLEAILKLTNTNSVTTPST